MQPSKEIPPSALVARLLERPRPSVVVPYPVGPGVEPFDVRLVIPTNHNEEQFKLRGVQWFADWAKKTETRVDVDAGVYRDIIGDRIAKETLADVMCLLEPDMGSGKPVYFRVFRSVAELTSVMTSDEIAIMWEHFLQLQREISPYQAVLTEADVDAWVERLKAGISPLAQLALQDCRELTLMLSRRVSALQSTGSESPDSQQESSPSISGLSQLENSAPGIGSSGEPGSNCLTRLGELLTPEEAAAKARDMRGGS